MLLELGWAWSCDHFYGELSLVTDCPLSTMHLPNIQPEFSHMQLHITSVSLLLVTTFGCQGTLLTHLQLPIKPNSQMSFCRAALQPLIPQFVHITRTTSFQIQNPPFALVKFHPVDDCPALWPTEIFNTDNETQLTYWFNLEVKRELRRQFAAGF